MAGTGQVASPFRPPWALAEARFLDACSRCGACREACPTGLLHKGSGGFPEADFSSAHCTFCGDCRKACPTGALQRGQDIAPWSLTAAIEDGCLTRQGVVCRTCGESCEAGAIAFRLQLGGVAIPRLDAGLCTGCGECVSDCPSRAIRLISTPQGTHP